MPTEATRITSLRLALADPPIADAASPPAEIVKTHAYSAAAFAVSFVLLRRSGIPTTLNWIVGSAAKVLIIPVF